MRNRLKANAFRRGFGKPVPALAGHRLGPTAFPKEPKVALFAAASFCAAAEAASCVCIALAVPAWLAKPTTAVSAN